MRVPLDIAGVAFGLALAWALAPTPAHADLGKTQRFPPLRGHVNDYAGILPADRAAALEGRLAAYKQQTGHQFVLLTVESLDGASINEYAVEVFEQWKLGSEKEDDGLLLVVVPGAPGERKLWIEVGHGLEGVIPDAIAARTYRDVLVPAFRQNDYAGGIDAAFGALMYAASGGQADGEPAAAPERERRRRAPLIGPMLLPLLMFVMFGLLGGRGRRRRGFFIMGPGFGGGFGGGMGGGFGGGGFGGGGGFSGGGGTSGGGGAGGSW